MLVHMYSSAFPNYDNPLKSVFVKTLILSYPCFYISAAEQTIPVINNRHLNARFVLGVF